MLLFVSVVAAAAAAAAAAAPAPVTVSLGSAAGVATWTVANANASITAPARVPGQIHLDLLAAGLIGEPFAELNVDAQQWVRDEVAWVWTASFAPPPALLAKRMVELIAGGIDTVANVTLNGVLLWSTADAFERSVADVSALLHAVAVVKAGVFSVVKVILYIFGLDTLGQAGLHGAADWLVVVAGFTIVSASIVALGADNLKRRLAYSTISQLAAMPCMALAIAGPRPTNATPSLPVAAA